MATTIPGLAIKIDGDASGLEKTLAGVKGSVSQLLGPATVTAISAGITAGIMVADKAFQALSTAINLAERGLAKFMATADRLGKLKDLGEQLNMGVGELVGLNRGARMSGSSGEDLQAAMLKMRGNLGDAIGGGNDPFGAIGLSLEKLSTLSSSGQLGAVFDALNKITDPSRRAAAGEDIFGKMYKSIELLSRGGSGGIQGLIKEAERLGITLDGALLGRVDRADDALADAGQQFEAIGDKLMSSFAPAIERAAKSLTELMAALSKEGGALDKIVSRMEAAAQFSSDYVSNAASMASKGAAMSGVGSPLVTGLLKQMLGPAVMDGFNSVNTLGSRIEKSNSLDSDISEVKRKRGLELAADDARKEIMRGRLGGLFGGMKGIAGQIGGGIMQGAQGLNWAEKQAMDWRDAQGKGKPIAAPQFAGALEQGSAAAYAAAYQNDQQKKHDEQIAKNTESANKLLEKSEKWLGKIAEKIGFKQASV